jgi:hypothetical protein
MKKIISAEAYLIEKFEDALQEVDNLKEVINLLKEENEVLKQRTGEVDLKPIVLPVLEVRYRANFSTCYIREEDFEAYKKAIADNDFEKIEKLYKQRYYSAIISDVEINCIMEIGGTKFYCYAQLYNGTLYSFPDYIKLYKSEEEAQEAVIKQIKEYIEEKEVKNA